MPTINLKQHRFTGRDVATETTLYIAQLSTFGLNSQNFEIFTFFPAAPMPKRFEPAFSKTTHFVPQEVPQPMSPTVHGQPPEFGFQTPRVDPLQIFVVPFSHENLRAGGRFLDCVRWGPQGPATVKFWQLYLGPLSCNKIPNFCHKSTSYQVTGICPHQKSYVRAIWSPYEHANFSPVCQWHPVLNPKNTFQPTIHIQYGGLLTSGLQAWRAGLGYFQLLFIVQWNCWCSCFNHAQLTLCLKSFIKNSNQCN